MKVNKTKALLMGAAITILTSCGTPAEKAMDDFNDSCAVYVAKYDAVQTPEEYSALETQWANMVNQTFEAYDNAYGFYDAQEVDDMMKQSEGYPKLLAAKEAADKRLDVLFPDRYNPIEYKAPAQTKGDAADDEDQETTQASEFDIKDVKLRPLTTEVSGVLAGYVTVEDKEYGIDKKSTLGELLLEPEFKINGSYTFTEEIKLWVELYDANGKKVTFNAKGIAGKYTMKEFDSFSAGFLQVALKDGKSTCDKTSFRIKIKDIIDYDPEMLKDVKSFKVFSKKGSLDFNYDSVVYK